MRLKSVGIIGYGSFGHLAERLFKRFVPRVKVRIFSSHKNPNGRNFFSLEHACASDAVILAAPTHALEPMLKRILPLTRPDTVIVDIATVKLYTTGLLARYAKKRRYLATHPMFGPESYEKSGENVRGFRIVVTKHTPSQTDYADVVSLLRALGFDVVETTPKKHDRHLAETLFLTHFIGQTIDRAGFTRTDIDTVSFRFLMDAVESVKNDRELFEDVFRYDPYCEITLAKLERAESGTHALLRKSSRRHLRNAEQKS